MFKLRHRRSTAHPRSGFQFRRWTRHAAGKCPPESRIVAVQLARGWNECDGDESQRKGIYVHHPKIPSDLRKLLGISDDYAVLFLQGGATTQFASIPLNICKPDDPVDYIVTGSWGDKAFKEATKYCKPKVIWSGKSDKYTGIPEFNDLDQNPEARYLHICANETIHGVEFKDYPTPKNKSGWLICLQTSVRNQ
ncbi:hypothetical protein L1987_39795 [Smallanthus sonchifolius]|uniref:Uncharacterized protein n=1 Tax=Smallanthus sonchifolius TaxID=185202 RepID=A0ACB9HN09_9ASTR|nr:hypothetical protein L1987_39795 [Smallanthus sonchifolius]